MIHNDCPIDISWIKPPITPAHTDLAIGKDSNGHHRFMRAYFDGGKFVFGIEYEGESVIDFDEYRSKIIKESSPFNVYQDN